jgi:hypothetical protein
MSHIVGRYEAYSSLLGRVFELSRRLTWSLDLTGCAVERSDVVDNIRWSG